MTEAASDQGAPDWLHARAMREDIIFRTLAEIYLLIDNIASSLNKTLPSISGLDSSDDGKPDRMRVYAPHEWLTMLGKIEWPPGNEAPREEEAATFSFLTTVRDALTRQAYPASALSIAFTQMVIRDEDRLRSDASINTQDFANTTTISKDNFTKTDLAKIVFPAVKNQVSNGKFILNIYPYIIIFVLIATILLSYQATNGASLTTQFDSLRA